jgi:elongation factor Ts
VEKNLKETTDELSDRVSDVISRIKENITIRRFKVLPVESGELAVDYVHGEGGIGVIVKIQSDKAECLSDERVRAFAFDVALHVAAYNPMYLSKDKVNPAYLKEQEEIFTKQAQSLGKPENVLAGIVKGKINKHLSEICLLQQAFVKDDKQSVQQMQEKIGKEIGATVSITDFLYFRVGEELE